MVTSANNIEDAAVHKLHLLVMSIYAEHNIRMNISSTTPFHKTYQYRYLRSLLDKFNELEFNEKQQEYFIKVVVRYAIANKMAVKGFSIFHQANMIQVCLSQVQSDLDRFKRLKGMIQSAREWIHANGQGLPIEDVLLKRQKAASNIVLWYQANKLPDEFLALSKECRKALSQLPKHERVLLPSDAALYSLRIKLKEVSQI